MAHHSYPDWPFEMKQAMSGKGTWFTSHLLRLIAKADPYNKAKIKLGFPEHVDAYERWMTDKDEFAEVEED